MNVVDDVHEALWRQPEAGSQDSDVRSRIRELVNDALPLARAEHRDDVVAAVWARINGLGPLQPFAEDEDVTEIMVNAGREVWVERHGELMRVECAISPTQVEQIARRLASTVGRRIDRSSPTADIRLGDGSRLHAVLPPLAVDGPALTIRRFGARTLRVEDLASPIAAAVLLDAVTRRASIVVAGGTSSGKTTLLNALAAEADPADRIVTIEDAAELRIPHPHVVRLEARPALGNLLSIELRELVRNALRMRPDRIICGEMRGPEALDLVQAMNTGHDGSLTTVHANGPADALRRIETMVLTADTGLPLTAVREQLTACIDLIVMIGRAPDGGRRVTSIAEVPDAPGDGWTTSPLVADADRLGEPVRSWATR